MGKRVVGREPWKVRPVGYGWDAWALANEEELTMFETKIFVERQDGGVGLHCRFTTLFFLPFNYDDALLEVDGSILRIKRVQGTRESQEVYGTWEKITEPR